jgi:hypothetical protein
MKHITYNNLPIDLKRIINSHALSLIYSYDIMLARYFYPIINSTYPHLLHYQFQDSVRAITQYNPTGYKTCASDFRKYEIIEKNSPKLHPQRRFSQASLGQTTETSTLYLIAPLFNILSTRDLAQDILSSGFVPGAIPTGEDPRKLLRNILSFYSKEPHKLLSYFPTREITHYSSPKEQHWEIKVPVIKIESPHFPLEVPVEENPEYKNQPPRFSSILGVHEQPTAHAYVQKYLVQEVMDQFQQISIDHPNILYKTPITAAKLLARQYFKNNWKVYPTTLVFIVYAFDNDKSIHKSGTTKKQLAITTFLLSSILNLVPKQHNILSSATQDASDPTYYFSDQKSQYTPGPINNTVELFNTIIEPYISK